MVVGVPPESFSKPPDNSSSFAVGLAELPAPPLFADKRTTALFKMNGELTTAKKPNYPFRYWCTTH